jgi:hypothetical protein
VVIWQDKRSISPWSPGVYDEFCKYAGLKGIRVSPWVNAKMKEFIAEAEKAARKKK